MESEAEHEAEVEATTALLDVSLFSLSIWTLKEEKVELLQQFVQRGAGLLS